MSEPTSPQFPQQPYPMQPPKKSRKTLWIVLGVIFGVMILSCGGCLAVVGLGANEIDKAIKEEEKNDKPHDVTVGEAFEHDDYSADAGWALGKDSLGDFEVTGLKITNDIDEVRTAFLAFRVYKGTEVIATIDCSSNELQGGESSALDCFSTDSYVDDFDTVKVADSF